MPMLKPVRFFRSFALFAALLVPALAHAQDQRLRLSVGGATTAGTIDSELAIAASVGYRFADRLSFDVEITDVEAPADRFPDVRILGQGVAPAGVVRLGSTMVDSRRGLFAQAVPAGAFGQGGAFGFPASPEGFRIDRDGRTIVATFGFRYEFASQIARFLPYVSGGIGVARTEESLRLSVPAILARPGTNVASRPTMVIDEDVSHSGLATSAGVGASIRLFGQLSADLDARYFRLHPGRNLGRLGGGISYRF